MHKNFPFPSPLIIQTHAHTHVNDTENCAQRTTKTDDLD